MIWLPLLLWLTGIPAGPELPDAAIAHKFYVTYGRMAVEGSVAVCRIRFFQDDLENTMRWFSNDDGFVLGATSEADSLFLAYIEDRFQLKVSGQTLSSSVIGSGEEQDMWWYTVQFDATETIDDLQIINRLLFDLLPDQRNILKVSHFPSEKERTLYFVAGSDAYTFTF